jgi:capsular exopolysaccharide synthesis family protein
MGWNGQRTSFAVGIREKNARRPVIGPGNAQEPSAEDIRQLGSLLWTRKWTVIGVAGVVFFASLVVSSIQRPVYASKASVLVESPPDSSPQDAPNMSTEKQVATSPAVAAIVINALHLAQSPHDVLQGLSVDVPVDSDVLVFKYSDKQRRVAQLRVQAFADGYLKFRQQQLVSEREGSQQSIQDRIGALTANLGTVERQVEQQQDPGKATVLRAHATSIITQIGILQQKLADLASAQSASAGTILEPAALPRGRANPNLLVIGFLAILAGLMLGVLAAVVRERTDDRLRGREDLEFRAGAPVLGSVPILRVLNGSAGELVTMQRPDSIAAEAFRQLRANVAVAAEQSGAKSLLITSCGGREGKTFTVANLGVALAKIGKRVILVSTDFQKPRLEELFGVFPQHGLADLLSENAPPATPALVHHVGIKNLAVVSVGSVGNDSAELLASNKVSTFIQDLRSLSDFVLVDCAPLLPVADAAAVALACDAVLLVADSRFATRSQVSEARNQLDSMRATVLGAVLLKAERRSFHDDFPSIDNASNGMPAPESEDHEPVSPEHQHA